MMGAGLKRYSPQGGGGCLKDVLRDLLSEGAKGFKSSWPHPKKAIHNATSRAKGAAKRAAKRKAEEVIHKSAKRALNDIFG